MNFTRTILLSATVALAMTSSAMASTASVGVTAPKALTTTVAKNFTRSQTPKTWSLGGCRLTSTKNARCSTYEPDGTRHIASIMLSDEGLSATIA
jgi:hypothetical protein